MEPQSPYKTLPALVWLVRMVVNKLPCHCQALHVHQRDDSIGCSGNDTVDGAPLAMQQLYCTSVIFVAFFIPYWKCKSRRLEGDGVILFRESKNTNLSTNKTTNKKYNEVKLLSGLKSPKRYYYKGMNTRTRSVWTKCAWENHCPTRRP